MEVVLLTVKGADDGRNDAALARNISTSHKRNYSLVFTSAFMTLMIEMPRHTATRV